MGKELFVNYSKRSEGIPMENMIYYDSSTPLFYFLLHPVTENVVGQINTAGEKATTACQMGDTQTASVKKHGGRS